MNRFYLLETLKNMTIISCYYRDNICLDINEISMCYNVALPKIWNEIFNINSLDDIKNRLKDVFKNNIILEGIGNKGWSIDKFIYIIM